MTQFHQVFFDETAEHLANMEYLLLAMDVAHPEAEKLNAVFRAVHSIKGGAATFGFADLAELTHALENLLDRLRKQALVLTDAMVEVFLRAKDVLQGMLTAHRGGPTVGGDEVSAVTHRLAQLAEVVPVPLVEHATPTSLRCRVLLELWPGEDVDIAAALESLGRCGELAVVQQGNVDSQQPWVASFCSELTASEVADTLAFVLPPERFSVRPDGGVEEDADFGLFLDPPDTAVPVAPLVAYEEDGFGLFAPLPTPEPVAPVSANPAVPLAEAASSEPAATRSIRVNIEKVDLLLNLVGELVITQSMLLQSGQALDPVEHPQLLDGINALQRHARELQEAVMSIRMTPVSFVFDRFPRVVRDLASRMGKQVELRMVGEATELDKGFIEKLVDPLTHLVRNSLDHGIEAPEVRLAKNKPAQGRLTLLAFHQGGSIVIEVTDDGAGLDRRRILAKARERGMACHDSMTDAEVWALIFEAGFTTADEVSEVSGRGVGMDVVKRNIQSMGGRIDIDTLRDAGTTISIRLPLTLAIMDGMSVRVGSERYVLPLSFILESLQPAPGEIKTIAGRGRVVNLRGDYLPVVSLADYLEMPEADTPAQQGIVVIVQSAETRLALLVDELIGQQQCVVKNLESNYRQIDGVAGATILSDGQVALILDVAAIARHNQRALQQRNSGVWQGDAPLSFS